MRKKRKKISFPSLGKKVFDRKKRITKEILAGEKISCSLSFSGSKFSKKSDELLIYLGTYDFLDLNLKYQ
jgi:hypothetical protein